MSVPNNFAVALNEHQHQDAQIDTVEFDKDEVRTLRPAPQIITVLSGCAWVTLNEQDIILETGAQFKLSPGKYRAVISSANNNPLVYSVFRIPSPTR